MSVTFADLGLAEPIVKALADRGITEPFPIQALSIPDAITGRDVCGKAKTGSDRPRELPSKVLLRLRKSYVGTRKSVKVCFVHSHTYIYIYI